MTETMEQPVAIAQPAFSEATQQFPAIRPTQSLQVSAQPLTLLERAMERGASLEQMRELMALQERHEANEARKAFLKAEAAFKAENVVIVRDRENKQYNSQYTSLGNLVNTVTPFLSKHGLSASWDQTQDGPLITVICTLSHGLGHSKSTQFTVPPDTAGAKNPIQQIKSAITYAKAVTFESVCGLASTDANHDDDGSAAGGTVALGKVTEAIADGLLADLAKTTTDADAAALWRTGSKTLHATGNVAAYDEFKAAVVAHRNKLADKLAKVAA